MVFGKKKPCRISRKDQGLRYRIPRYSATNEPGPWSLGFYRHVAWHATFSLLHSQPTSHTHSHTPNYTFYTHTHTNMHTMHIFSQVTEKAPLCKWEWSKGATLVTFCLLASIIILNSPLIDLFRLLPILKKKTRVLGFLIEISADMQRQMRYRRNVVEYTWTIFNI